LKNSEELGMMIHTYNPSTLEAEARESRVPGQPELYSEKSKSKERKIKMSSLSWKKKIP
jgi:hypothetical protein